MCSELFYPESLLEMMNAYPYSFSHIMTSAVATKDDLIQLENRMNTKFDAKLDALEQRIDAKLDLKFDAFESKIDIKMEQQFERFQVLTENLAYDFRGAHKDKISQHEDRITVLEKRVGIKT